MICEIDNPASTGDGGFDVAVDSAQNIVIVGAHDRVDLMEGENALVRKYDADGVLLWERQHDEAMLGDRANGVAIDSQDAIVVAGTVDAGDGSGPALWVRKYAP